MTPDIENLVSIRITALAQWRCPKGGQYSIVLNPAGSWTEAAEIVERYRGYPSPDPSEGWWPCHDLIIDCFAESLAMSYLIERICVERRLNRIRFRRDHCKPCCVMPVAIAMWNHISEGVRFTTSNESES
ncbi:MAG: hypothetical protein WC683_05045 [bacterium]